MIAERYSASLQSRLMVPNSNRIPQGYFRSKLFSASFTTNPLVAAAGPLFSLLERLCISTSLPPINELHTNIEHELNAFYSRLSALNFAEELIAIAHYVLSATIDELLGKNYLRLYGQPSEFRAFTPSAPDGIGPEQRFFEIVAYVKQRTNQYLDLLELTYYCLIAGFEGENHLRADGRQTLDNLIEELYQLIQTHRVNKPVKLFKEATADIPEPPINRKPIIMALLVVGGFMLSIYFASHALLEHKANTVIQGHKILANMEH